jgi:O-acetyl-ADP-ribose deacetylase (regulator of RNase III)
MITYLKSDLFESPAQVLVNAVNTIGAMGKGIALEFKRKYPEMFKQYQTHCKNGAFDIGQLWLYKSPEKWVLNFPTKRDWRDSSRIEYIDIGLKRFVETYEAEGIKSISFPRLGSGLGGLNWENEVKPLMEKYLNPLPIEVIIHMPD